MTASLPDRLPAETSERANDFARPQQRHLRHQTVTSTSCVVTVNGRPIWVRTARHSRIAFRNVSLGFRFGLPLAHTTGDGGTLRNVHAVLILIYMVTRTFMALPLFYRLP